MKDLQIQKGAKEVEEHGGRWRRMEMKCFTSGAFSTGCALVHCSLIE